MRRPSQWAALMLRAMTTRALASSVRHAARVSALALTCALGTSAAALAADPTVSVTVTPAEVTLVTGTSASGVVIVTNAGSVDLSAVTITASASDASVEASVGPFAATTIRAGSSASAEFTVKRVSEGSTQPTFVRFIVSFTSSVGATTTSQVLAGSVKVTSAAAPSLVKATFDGGPSGMTINEFRPGDTALVVTNLREASVRVSAIEVNAPDGVRVAVVCPGELPLTVTTQPLVTRRFSCEALRIAPRSQQLLRVRLSAPDTVSPGSRSVVIRLTATDDRVSEDVVAVLPVTVDIFAEAEILKSLGVPVFLLVPGLVVLVSAWTAWVLTPFGRSGTPLPTANPIGTAVLLGVFSLVLSLVMAALYPILTGLIYPRAIRDYTRAYGFRDFYLVFAYSLALGAIVGSMPWIVYARRALLRQNQLSETDTPRDLLRKLGHGSGKLQFPRATVEGKTGLAVRDAGAKTLVMPRVRITLVPEDKALRDALDAHIANNDARALFEEIQRRPQENVALAWGGKDVVGRPKWVDAPTPGLVGSIVEIESAP